MKKRLHTHRAWVDVLTAFSVALSIASQWSYELGPISMVVPPEWKPRMAVIGVIATLVLQVSRPFLPPVRLGHAVVHRGGSDRARHAKSRRARSGHRSPGKGNSARPPAIAASGAGSGR